MASERRTAQPTRPVRRVVDGTGFSLIEILLVLAVMALLGALLLPGVNSMLRSMNEVEPDGAFRDVLMAAREQALSDNRTVVLRSDAERRLLLWGDEIHQQQRGLAPGTSLQLLQATTGGSVLLGGVLVESQEVPLVRFYPDGTCDRFRAQISRSGARPQVIAIDPWTCAPLPEAAVNP